MDEISRCCKIIGVESGASLEEVKKAYRDLVQVWHPDRFSGNERLQLKAQEKLKEINAAYEFLIANAFENDALVTQPAIPTPPTPQPPPKEPEAPEEELEASRPGWGLKVALMYLMVLVMIGGGMFLYWKFQRRTTQPTPLALNQETNPVTTPTAPVVVAQNQDSNAVIPNTEKLPPVSTQTKSAAGSTDMLAVMIPVNDIEVSQDADGLRLTSKGDRDCFQFPQLLRPPFTIRTTVKTELRDLRLHYALGMVIFDWANNPLELRVADPVTGNVTPVTRRGLLNSNEWHDLVWEITTNSMKVTADGGTCFEGKGDYRRIKGYAGIGGDQDQILVKNFIVESQMPVETKTPVSLTKPAPIPGDILNSMVPIGQPKVTHEPDGISLYASSLASLAAAAMLRSTNTFHVPFIIRTVAKTDSTDLRLYAGPAGRMIFNWEGNPSELRVHEPANNQLTPVAGKGLIWPNEWHEITWEIWGTGMRVIVDGQLRFQNKKDYHTIQGPVGIGPTGSTVTVKSFAVEQK